MYGCIQIMYIVKLRRLDRYSTSFGRKLLLIFVLNFTHIKLNQKSIQTIKKTSEGTISNLYRKKYISL